jgi:hypothetical protein
LYRRGPAAVEMVDPPVPLMIPRIKRGPFSTPRCPASVVLDPEGNAITLHEVTQPW